MGQKYWGLNGAAEYGLGRESGRGKMFTRIAKFCYTILQMEQEELFKRCYDWQIGNMKWERWASSLREEIYKTGLKYVWLNGKDCDTRLICQKIVNRCNNIQTDQNRQ